MANRPKATLHSFRVTFNNQLRDMGLSIEDRQALLAHSSSETTKIYTHPNFDLALKFVNRLPDFAKRNQINDTMVYRTSLFYIRKKPGFSLRKRAYE
ncbi:MAG: tyrosine-type recombinase/integrase [Candidatus Marinimicrobia bacterium]|nr:tyrosine-type recombinase/integrase [Candidatus Neomarinimicrobiota bacterium]